MSDPQPVDSEPCACAEAPGCGHRPGPEARLAAAIWPGNDDRDTSLDQADAEVDSVWCRGELSPLGSYMLVISYDQDNVLSLTRDQLLEYVATLNEALLRAQYAEGVRRQLADILRRNRSGLVQDADRYAMYVVQSMRDDWPPLPTFSPYRIVPIVAMSGRTSVQVVRGGKPIVQFAAQNVKEHVVHALRVYAACDLDSSYRRHLTGVIGLDPGRAEAAVDDLSNYLTED